DDVLLRGSTDRVPVLADLQERVEQLVVAGENVANGVGVREPVVRLLHTRDHVQADRFHLLELGVGFTAGDLRAQAPRAWERQVLSDHETDVRCRLGSEAGPRPWPSARTVPG